MERSDVLDAMGKLKLYGMRASYDEIITAALKRQHEPQQIIGDLLTAEISEKQARSIKYQMTIAKLPLAKELEEFDFDAAEVNETLVRDLATGDFLDHQRNLVLIGGTGREPLGAARLAQHLARQRNIDRPTRRRGGKTQPQAKRLHKQLTEAGVKARLLDEGSVGFSTGIVICTPHLAKGLEFDCVVIPDASAKVFSTEMDRNLLYVACTRAMHRLSLVSVGAPSPFLPTGQYSDA